MIGNFIKEATSTTGTGTVTLTSVAGFSRFSDQFAAGALVAYAIEDGNNRETGIGTVASGNTLERTVVLSKLDGGTYSEYPASGLSLSGSAKVFLSPDRASLLSGFAGVATDAEIYSAHAVTSSAPNRSQGDGFGDCVYLMPFLLLGRMRVKALSAYCSAAAAGSITRLGLYSAGKDGLPDSLIVQTGNIDSASTGAKVASVSSTVVAPGWYYTALANRSGYPGYYAYATTQNKIATPLGGAFRYAFKSTPAWTELPDKIVTPSISAGSAGDFAVALIGA